MPPRRSGTCPASSSWRAPAPGGGHGGATWRPTRSSCSRRPPGGPTRSPRPGACSAGSARPTRSGVARCPRPPGVDPPEPPERFVSNLDRATYERMVEAVREAIAAGELYQANVARRLEAPFDGDPWPLHRRLRAGDPALFSAFVDRGPDSATGRPRALFSASPEPFLAIDPAGRVSTDPIKGTRPRGRTPEEDRALAAELVASAKDRAENTMIV